jgi:protein tyrosine/serine phosphatase
MQDRQRNDPARVGVSAPENARIGAGEPRGRCTIRRPGATAESCLGWPMWEGGKERSVWDKVVRRRIRIILLLVLLAGGIGGWAFLAAAGIDVWAILTAREAPALSAEDRPKAWATPIERPGLANLHRVSPDLYRGAQPTGEGMRELKNMGVRTVVDLRSFHSDRDQIGQTGLAYTDIPMKAWHPEDEDVVRFLRIATDRDRVPVFVHCQQGSDRAGIVCAAYRVVVQGWTKQEAIREMTEGGFGFHEGLGNLVRYVRGLDVRRIREQLGIHGLAADAGAGPHLSTARVP